VVLGLAVLATFAVAAPASWLVAAVGSQPLRWPPLAELAQGRAAGWLAGTNAGSVAAAAGVPVPGAPGGTLGVTTTLDGPPGDAGLAVCLGPSRWSRRCCSSGATSPDPSRIGEQQ